MFMLHIKSINSEVTLLFPPSCKRGVEKAESISTQKGMGIWNLQIELQEETGMR